MNVTVIYCNSKMGFCSRHHISLTTLFLLLRIFGDPFAKLVAWQENVGRWTLEMFERSFAGNHRPELNEVNAFLFLNSSDRYLMAAPLCCAISNCKFHIYVLSSYLIAFLPPNYTVYTLLIN